MNSGDTSSDAGTGHSAGRPCAGTTSSQYLDFVTFLSRHYTCPHTRDLATEATRFHYIPPHASNTNRAGVVACLQTLHDARSERGRAHTHAARTHTHTLTHARARTHARTHAHTHTHTPSRRISVHTHNSAVRLCARRVSHSHTHASAVQKWVEARRTVQSKSKV